MAQLSQEVDLEPESDEDPGEQSLCPLIGLRADGIEAESHEVEENALEKTLWRYRVWPLCPRSSNQALYERIWRRCVLGMKTTRSLATRKS